MSPGATRCAAKVAGAVDDGFIRLLKDAGNSKLGDSQRKPGDRATETFAKEGLPGFNPLPQELRGHPRYKIEGLLASGAMATSILPATRSSPSGSL